MRYERDGWQVESAIRKNKPPPQWYLDEPEIPEEADFFYAAYNDLATCRPPDGSIPWTAAMLYTEYKGLERDTSEIVWRVVKAIDGAVDQWQAEELERIRQNG